MKTKSPQISFFSSFLFLFIIAMAMVSCERPFSEEIATGEPTGEGEAHLRMSAITSSELSFSSIMSPRHSASAVASACSRITFAVYKDGERVAVTNQDVDDSNFGSCDMVLPKGTYRIVVVGHNGAGSATTTEVEKITFKNNKMTDTFWCTSTVNLDDDTDVSLNMKRVVAMFRLKVTDNIPANVAEMKFYYTGGSSTLSGVTGFGSVNSKQTEVRTVEEDMHTGGAEFEIYTIPHEQDDVLNITVTALDAEGKTVKETVFSDVAVTVNKIRQYEGEFFSESAEEGRGKVLVTVDDEWSGTDTEAF